MEAEETICNTVLASVRGLEWSWRSSSPPQKSERTNGLQGTRCFNSTRAALRRSDWQCDQTGALVRNLTYSQKWINISYKDDFVIQSHNWSKCREFFAHILSLLGKSNLLRMCAIKYLFVWYYLHSANTKYYTYIPI